MSKPRFLDAPQTHTRAPRRTHFTPDEARDQLDAIRIVTRVALGAVLVLLGLAVVAALAASALGLEVPR